MTIRLAMWSGPRNISTAMMRSWENRPDCTVVDEPFYAYFLKASGRDDPGRDEIIAAGTTDWREVVEELIRPVPDGPAIFYQKQMPHHMTAEIDLSWVDNIRNALLIREPHEVVASYIRSRHDLVREDVGLVQQVKLFNRLRDRGEQPPVIDANDFLRAPEPYLRWLCDWLGVEFTDRMLTWPQGPRDTDGVWAPYWYAAVEQSTGFQPWHPREVQLEGEPLRIAEESVPDYEMLAAHRLRLSA
ncbi:MAG TPA: HAD family hydrolase [Nocardioidaceae bacterium]|nr:HAD family hydrolase [Nocardioidaceae bacterium]